MKINFYSKKFDFERWRPPTNVEYPAIVLYKDSWDDYIYKTSYHMRFFNSASESEKIGYLKIAHLLFYVHLHIISSAFFIQFIPLMNVNWKNLTYVFRFFFETPLKMFKYGLRSECLFFSVINVVLAFCIFFFRVIDYNGAL